jgi:hypothetical protein
MRVLFLIPELGFGGAETSLLRLADHLSCYYETTIAVFRSADRRVNFALNSHQRRPSVLVIDNEIEFLQNILPLRLVRWYRRLCLLRQLKR